MSINHLIDAETNPRYDIYVKEIYGQDMYVSDITALNIEAKSIDVNGNIVLTEFGTVAAPVINATTTANLASQNNYNDILNEDTPSFVNPYLINEGFNTFVNLRDMDIWIRERRVAGNTLEIYKFSWTGDSTALPGDDAVFDFKSRNGYSSVVSVQASCQWSVAADTHDMGVVISAPQDPANDFEVTLDTTNVGNLVSAEVYFELEITLRVIV